MYKLIVLAMMVCAASAGLIGGYGTLGHGVAYAAAPVAVAAPAVAVAHGASSYQNNNLLALNPTAVVTKVAAPVAVAAPYITKVAAPVAYAAPVAAPVAYAAPVAVAPFGLGYGKGLAYGGWH